MLFIEKEVIDYLKLKYPKLSSQEIKERNYTYFELLSIKVELTQKYLAKNKKEGY